jgi:hypothetical protein
LAGEDFVRFEPEVLGPALVRLDWPSLKGPASQRLKRSGTRRPHPGGQVLLTSPAPAQSDRFAHGGAPLTATYRAEVVVPDSVTPLPRQRGA